MGYCLRKISNFTTLKQMYTVELQRHVQSLEETFSQDYFPELNVMDSHEWANDSYKIIKRFADFIQYNSTLHSSQTRHLALFAQEQVSLAAYRLSIIFQTIFSQRKEYIESFQTKTNRTIIVWSINAFLSVISSIFFILYLKAFKYTILDHSSSQNRIYG